MASKPANNPETTESEKWQCGTPYRYPVTGDGDHWEKLLEPLLEKDSAQCQLWRDEVQNLLIFAGLFSAVVTAFVVLSYSELQPDQEEIMISLLARIATRLENPSNGTSSSNPEPINTASLASPIAISAIRINVFWFISLVLSLTTALVGIVSLQWLREHQQYQGSTSARDKFALFNMRARGLEAWYVPEIFSSLPVLLQLALVLFFTGLIDFLLTASLSVAIPVIISIGIPMMFVILTTAIPALHTFIFILPFVGSEPRVPNQAPYKSPQSRLFKKFLTSSQRFFRLVAHSIYSAYFFLFVSPWRLYRRLKAHQDVSEEAMSIISTNSSLSANVSEVWVAMQRSTWLSYDEEWLGLRDAYAKSIFDQNHWMTSSGSVVLSKVVPFFDLTNGILMTTVSNEATILSLAYLSIQELSSSIKDDAGLPYSSAVQRSYYIYLQALVDIGKLGKLEPLPNLSLLLRDPSPDLMVDETHFVFLFSFEAFLSIALLQHRAELHIRMANYLYPVDASQSLLPLLEIPEPLSPTRFYYTANVRSSPDAAIRHALDGAISEQFSLFIKTYFQVVADTNIDYEAIQNSSFGQKVSAIFEGAAFGQSSAEISFTLNAISSSITQALQRTLDKRTDLLFYVASRYVRILLLWDSEEAGVKITAAIRPFLSMLRQYLEARGTPDPNLREGLGIPDTSDRDWWGFLNSDREQIIETVDREPHKPPSRRSGSHTF